MMPAAPRRARVLRLFLVTALVVMLVPVSPVAAQEVAPATVSDVLEDVDQALGAPEAQARGLAAPVRRTSTLAPEIAFVGVGIKGHGPAPELRVRARDLDGHWGEWMDAGILDVADGPEPGSAEQRGAAAAWNGWATDAVWVGPSVELELEVTGEGQHGIEVTVIDSAGLSETLPQRLVRAMRSLTTPPAAEAQTASPTIIPRSGWGADESWRSGGVDYITPRHVVIHHTVTTNNYTQEQAPQQIRNMYHWHTKGMGWKDLGYNFVVDRYGRIYEGRYGGIARGVQGAHAANWNTQSFGVAIMGDYNKVDPTPVSLDAAARLIAWKYAVHGINPSPTSRVNVNGADIRRLEGHRNVRRSYIEWTSGTSFQNDCPGFNLSWRLPNVRDAIQAAYTAAGYTSGVLPDDGSLKDIATSPYKAEIEWLLAQGITTGYDDGTFRPQKEVTRQAMVAFLHRMHGSPAVSGSSGFSDVPSSHPFHTEITWARQQGIIQGWDDGTFRPTRTVTRQAVMSFLYEMAGSPAVDARLLYADVALDHPFHAAITWASDEAVASGISEGMFGPTIDATRETVASFLYETRTGGHA